MAVDLLAHLLEAVFGPLFLLAHLPELGAVAGDAGTLANLVLSGDLQPALDRLLSGEFDAGTKTLASVVGTVAWVAVVGSLLGEVGEFGGALELVELFD